MSKLTDKMGYKAKTYLGLTSRLKTAEKALEVEINPLVLELIKAKDEAGLMELIDELPKGFKQTRKLYEAVLRIQDETKKPTNDFAKLYHVDQYRVIQTLSNEAMKSIKDGSGCRAGLYIRSVNTALKLLHIVGKEWMILLKLSDRAIKAMDYRVEGMIPDYETAMAVEKFRVEVINEAYFAFHDALALMSIEPIEMQDSYFKHKNHNDEDELSGEVWLTRDKEYWDKH